MIYNNCQMTIVYFDGECADEGMVCTVKLDKSNILVEYEDETDNSSKILVQYVGKSRSEGHYELSCPEQGGRATLHCFKDAKVLEGFWVEDGYRGMWRIFLKE